MLKGDSGRRVAIAGNFGVADDADDAGDSEAANDDDAANDDGGGGGGGTADISSPAGPAVLPLVVLCLYFAIS